MRNLGHCIGVFVKNMFELSLFLMRLSALDVARVPRDRRDSMEKREFSKRLRSVTFCASLASDIQNILLYLSLAISICITVVSLVFLAQDGV